MPAAWARWAASWPSMASPTGSPPRASSCRRNSSPTATASASPTKHGPRAFAWPCPSWAPLTSSSGKCSAPVAISLAGMSRASCPSCKRRSRLIRRRSPWPPSAANSAGPSPISTLSSIPSRWHRPPSVRCTARACMMARMWWSRCNTRTSRAASAQIWKSYCCWPNLPSGPTS